MARVRFTLGTRYALDDHVYVVRQVLPDGILVVDDQHGGQQRVAIADLSVAWARGALLFDVYGPNTSQHDARARARSYTFADFQALPERQRMEAWRRYQLIAPLVHRAPHERTRTAIAAYVASLPLPITPTPASPPVRAAIGQAQSWASVERWLRALKTCTDARYRSLWKDGARR